MHAVDTTSNFQLGAVRTQNGEGEMGGHNVAFLLMKEFSAKGSLNPNIQGKELSTIMDNCEGQNKNNRRFSNLLCVQSTRRKVLQESELCHRFFAEK